VGTGTLELATGPTTVVDAGTGTTPPVVAAPAGTGVDVALLDEQPSATAQITNAIECMALRVPLKLFIKTG
jgi:hypothetical protein